MKPVLFFPCDTFHKDPVGAVKQNEQFTLRIGILSSYGAEEVNLSLVKEDETEVLYPLTRECADGNYDYFSLKMAAGSSGLYFYRFKIRTAQGNVCAGADQALNALIYGGGDWQLTVIREVYPPASIFAGGVMYQIFTDRFAVGGERLATKQGNEYRSDWGGTPRYTANERGEYAVDFFGGNLKGIIQKLDYLRSLGVTVLYLNPVFEARSNHKYDTADYLNIDSDFGTNEDFTALCGECRARGIRVMLDGVFSHTGSDSVYFNKEGRYASVGACQSKESNYYSWYKFKEYPSSYECWWDFETLPNVDELAPSYNSFINGQDGVVRTWLRRGADAWRLDVADELPDLFLDRLAEAVKAEKPSAIVLGEVWEDASNKASYGARRRYFEGRQLDSVMNYPFREAILAFVKSGEAESFFAAVHSVINNYPKPALDNLMNILGTHDTPRILTTLGCGHIPESKRERAEYRLPDISDAFTKLRMATALQYTLPGTPCIFYGDEAGIEGLEDPFCRACFPWGHERREFQDWYRALGRIREENRKIFAFGSFRRLPANDSVAAFVRESPAGAIITAVNQGAAATLTLPEGEYADLLTGGAVSGEIWLDSQALAILRRMDSF